MRPKTEDEGAGIDCFEVLARMHNFQWCCEFVLVPLSTRPREDCRFTHQIDNQRCLAPLALPSVSISSGAGVGGLLCRCETANSKQGMSKLSGPIMSFVEKVEDSRSKGRGLGEMRVGSRELDDASQGGGQGDRGMAGVWQGLEKVYRGERTEGKNTPGTPGNEHGARKELRFHLTLPTFVRESAPPELVSSPAACSPLAKESADFGLDTTESTSLPPLLTAAELRVD